MSHLDEPDWDGADWDDDDLMLLLETEHEMLIERLARNEERRQRIQECLWKSQP